MVADAVVYHPSVAHLLRFLATTLGRDKLYRTIQYFSRFYAWYLLRTNATKEAVEPWSAAKKQFGLLRKFLRLGKSIEHLRAAAVAADGKASSSGLLADPVLRYTSVGRQLGYAGYLTLDATTVLDAAGIRRWPRAPLMQQEAYRFWAMGISCSILAQLYTLYRLRQREAAVDLKDGEGVVESKRIAKERSASQTQLLCDFCDILVPSSALGWLSLDDGIVGLTGTLSSLIGVRSQWGKTA
ncbi:Peroxisomal biogenesis factor 11 (PEX11) [Geosmithia morbida]|uniref:Peroxisomal biogenesis factor 11 (PEX11) n=1 Tax=Geosmithia morbida TaxID=1094350 RepID=A0A9P4YUW4_9HYPO|nr:Peroxisomal biogenesis factor 11 (PEX11) [Geosmithia morbida]KAF4122141.1 Peroxisomal biogenesis factor 11 (PEX11) [Geosmithia morbida]